MGSPLYQIVVNICACFRAAHSVELQHHCDVKHYLCELIPQRLIYCLASLLIESKHQFCKKG